MDGLVLYQKKGEKKKKTWIVWELHPQVFTGNWHVKWININQRAAETDVCFFRGKNRVTSGGVVEQLLCLQIEGDWISLKSNVTGSSFIELSVKVNYPTGVSCLFTFIHVCVFILVFIRVCVCESSVWSHCVSCIKQIFSRLIKRLCNYFLFCVLKCSAAHTIKTMMKFFPSVVKKRRKYFPISNRHHKPVFIRQRRINCWHCRAAVSFFFNKMFV